MLTCSVLSSIDIAAWKLCVCVKRTRSTAQMKRELWHPSTRRRGGNERIRSLQAFERWSTERLKAKRKNNALFELYTIDCTMWQLTRSNCDLKKAAGAAAPFTQQNQTSGVYYLCQGNRVIFIRFFGWFVDHLHRIRVKRKAARQEQAGKIRGVDVLRSLWIRQAVESHGKALLPNANKCDFFLFHLFWLIIGSFNLERPLTSY